MAIPVSARPLTWLSVLALSVLVPEVASAFCRTSSCRDCPRDEKGCTIGGNSAAWPQACVSFSMAEEASRYVDLETATALMQEAFRTWEEVRCPPDGLHPSIDVANRFGPTMCSAVEYREGQGNANIISFRDDEWPYQGGTDTLATTSVTVAPNGDIYDADMEINSTLPLTIPDVTGPVTKGFIEGRHNLLSIMIHESGHFLGLDHTKDQRAIMRVALDPGDEQTYLGDDDIKGICAIYPPDRKSQECNYEPRGGFTPHCVDGGLRGGPACTITPTGTDSRAGVWVLVASGVCLSSRLRRRRSRVG